MGGDQEKVVKVIKYLSHPDGNVRAKALKKLEYFLARGKENRLIVSKLKAYLGTEKDSKYAAFAKQLINKYSGKGSSSKGSRISKPVFILLASVMLMVIVALLLTPADEKRKKGTKSTSILTSTKPKVKASDIRTPFSIQRAESISLGSVKKFDKVRPVQSKIKLRYIPPKGRSFVSNMKIVQQMNSNGRKISKRKVAFDLKRRILKTRKSNTDVYHKIFRAKGTIRPSMLGYPKVGKELVLQVNRDYKVSKVKPYRGKRSKGSNTYIFPFPIYPATGVKSGMTWGTNLSSENFGVISEYKLEGYTRFRNKKLYAISFLSVSESRNRSSTFSISRKGLFYVDSKTGVPEYLKLYTISETRLKGSGFPVENIVVVEETLN